MKHVFFVHSQITYLVAKRVIAYLKLVDKDCLFLIHRGECKDYKSIGIKMVAFPFNPYSIDSFPVFNKFWKSWRNLASLDKFISNVTLNNKFLFYTPQTYQKYLALILTHKNCQGFSIIEEGLGSYLDERKLKNVYPQNTYSLFQNLLWRLNFLNRLRIHRSFIDNKYKAAYGLTIQSFPDINYKEVVGLPTLNDYTKDVEEFYIENGNSILVFDGLVEGCIIDSGTLIMSIIIFLDYMIKKDVTLLYVKYHPDQIKAGKTIVLLKELFQLTNGINIIEIPQKVPLEQVALNQNAKFYVFVSSVGLYASLFGCEVYSLCKVVERLYSPFSHKIENLPSIFKDKVKFI